MLKVCNIHRDINNSCHTITFLETVTSLDLQKNTRREWSYQTSNTIHLTHSIEGVTYNFKHVLSNISNITLIEYIFKIPFSEQPCAWTDRWTDSWMDASSNDNTSRWGVISQLFKTCIHFWFYICIFSFHI